MPEHLPERHPGPRFRILFLTVGYLGFRSLAREFESFAASRDDLEAVHVVHRTETWMRFLMPRLPIRGPWSFATQSYTFFKRFHIGSWIRRGRLDLHRFDAVHTTTQHAAWAFARARDRAPFVLSCLMDATAQNHYKTFGTPPRIPNWPLDYCERRVYPRVDVIACMSQWAADSCVSDYGVPREKILRCPPVARPVFRSAPDRDDPARLRRIIFIGNDFARKGGVELLRAHQQRWADRSELHVVSAGATPDPAARNVVWHGAVPRERLLGEVLPSMDVFVMPTRRDMSPWVLVEAAACGVPVVTTRVGGTGELVEDGQTGFVTPLNDDAAFADAVDRLISDPALARRMGDAGRRRVIEQFTPEVVYGRLIERLKSEARALRARQGLAPPPW